ncbi:histone-lysine N-methyltransferase ASHR1 isoform X3 [Durio zibethinus]|uniref:Histone-lysine N-methyltransferase ASHR1 isoform X3 n=1 Tax=Durio zibethinus TaxID=66656 RepID=A0A6P6ATK1_DURZI|nr:histone-lysine N-methyltransferase ASHR1 isoform X3 [Durio zibethinus]
MSPPFNSRLTNSSSSSLVERQKQKLPELTITCLFMEELQTSLRAHGLTVSSLPDKGRSLFATKDFYPGEIIISQEPFVCVPNNSLTESRCDGCFSKSNLKKCSACQVVWYCGSTCQKLEWKLHRLECQALAKLNKERRKSVTPTIRMMVKLYLRRKLQNENVIPVTAIDNYNLVEALVSHMSDIDEKQLVLYAQMANLVKLILERPDIDIKEIAENFSKFACNAHSICDSELRPLGTGLYPVVSIINHSCLPNAVLVFEGRLAVVRAVQHIPKNSEGQYDDIQESAILEGYRCRDNRCSGFLLRESDDKGFVCQQCGLIRNKEEIRKIASDIKALSDKALKSTSSGNLQEAIILYKSIEKLQKEVCHPFSISLMPIREKLLEILMQLEEWKEALAVCRLTIPVYERVYPGFHPLLGLQYYSCGKLEWLLGETDDAIKSFTKAIDVLRITHGTNTLFMKELLMKLEEARSEASFKLSFRE